MRTRFAILSLALALLLPGPARAAERVALSGERAEIWNLAGKVVIEPGVGPDVVVLIERGGRDAAKLRMTSDRTDRSARLRVLYSGDRVIYSEPGSRSQSSSTVRLRDDGTWGGRSQWGGRRVTVASGGRGFEAHADLRVQVPRGKSVEIHVAVGAGLQNGVDADVSFDGGATSFTSRDTQGSLHVDVGSGTVGILQHAGDLLVDTGSGDVNVSRVVGGRIVLDTGSGRIDCDDVSGAELRVDTGSGGVALARIDTPRLLVDTGSGGVFASLLSKRTDVSIDTGSGGVKLELPSGFGADLRIATGSGGIRSDFTVAARERDRNSLAGRIGDGGSRLVIETGSGGVQLVRGR